MEIYAVKISDISEEKLKELCLLIDSEKNIMNCLKNVLI